MAFSSEQLDPITFLSGGYYLLGTSLFSSQVPRVAQDVPRCRLNRYRLYVSVTLSGEGEDEVNTLEADWMAGHLRPLRWPAGPGRSLSYVITPQTAIFGLASILMVGDHTSIFESIFPVVLERGGGSSCRCPQLSLEDVTDVSLSPALYAV